MNQVENKKKVKIIKNDDGRVASEVRHMQQLFTATTIILWQAQRWKLPYLFRLHNDAVIGQNSLFCDFNVL